MFLFSFLTPHPSSYCWLSWLSSSTFGNIDDVEGQWWDILPAPWKSGAEPACRRSSRHICLTSPGRSCRSCRSVSESAGCRVATSPQVIGTEAIKRCGMIMEDRAEVRGYLKHQILVDPYSLPPPHWGLQCSPGDIPHSEAEKKTNWCHWGPSAHLWGP